MATCQKKDKLTLQKSNFHRNVSWVNHLSLVFLPSLSKFNAWSHNYQAVNSSCDFCMSSLSWKIHIHSVYFCKCFNDWVQDLTFTFNHLPTYLVTWSNESSDVCYQCVVRMYSRFVGGCTNGNVENFHGTVFGICLKALVKLILKKHFTLKTLYLFITRSSWTYLLSIMP